MWQFILKPGLYFSVNSPSSHKRIMAVSLYCFGGLVFLQTVNNGSEVASVYKKVLIIVFKTLFYLDAVVLNASTMGSWVQWHSQTLDNATNQQEINVDVYCACQKISWRGCCCVKGSLVAVVVAVLLVVEAVVLEGLVPFFVPVTNSICGNKNDTSERQCKLASSQEPNPLAKWNHPI